ncbi:Tn3 family transposase [Xenorhabdus sp. XENO-1]|uniref:Tn3 family transposase n=1 Tax=Xenorhabdus bovienii TaxID=40576 RepID=UPI0020CA79C3|nr:Tn3 family transposase [Xenorhabdus bovienii]MCP9270250.1 Tn3 family transposase [Xenorhabdus bovienii subsp. africana]
MIGRCLSDERRRICEQLKSDLNPDVEEALTNLLSEESGGLHWITQLKKALRDFSYTEIVRESIWVKQLSPLYEFACQWLPSLCISNESIRYYATLIEYYSVYKLRRFDPLIAYFYLLCYTYHRTHVINDNLVEAFIGHVRQYEEAAKLSAKDMVYKRKFQANEDIKATGKILGFFLNPDITDNVSFGEIRTKAFQLLNREQMEIVTLFIGSSGFDEEEFHWQHLDTLSAAFKKNLRQIIRVLDFSSHTDESRLLEAAIFVQTCLRDGKILRRIPDKDFPVNFLTKSLQKYLYSRAKSPQLISDRYEFAVYRMLKTAFESGDIFNQNTTKYRSFTDDLIPMNRWKADKQRVLNDLDLPVLQRPISQTLQELKDELEEKLKHVNQRIISRKNKDVKFNNYRKGRTVNWTLPYKKEEDEDNHRFYHLVPTISITNLLSYVDKKTGFLAGFNHVLGRYTKGNQDKKSLIACIIALGTNMSLSRMGEISDISHQVLQTTYQNFFRLETLRESNDMVANATAKLSIFRHYDIESDVIHSSSDGQRFETQRNTANARYASKYFGLKKGISALTLVGNHVPINAKVIGTHEHESYFVFDLLYNNTTEIDPDRHSVDTHGTNQVNFWILYAFGYQFAPRYKNFPTKTEGIIGFEPPGKYSEEFLIKPIRKVNEERIVEEWPNIQHIMASLGQKETTQSSIVRKLSSYARQNKTKKALWELDNIIRSIYMLDYIDNKSLRQYVAKALNRGEAYHRLKKAIAHVNGGKMNVKSENEQHIIHECTRLIANAVIYFNAELLSSLFERGDPDGLFEMGQLGKISPVAWQHINFYGRFEFNDIATTFSVGEFVKSVDLTTLFTDKS